MKLQQSKEIVRIIKDQFYYLSAMIYKEFLEEGGLIKRYLLYELLHPNATMAFFINTPGVLN